MNKIGFIGTGNMGSALASAAARGLPGEEIMLANRTAAKAEQLAQKLGCRSADDCSVAASAKYIVLAVKPQMMAAMLGDVAPVLKVRDDRFVLVTIAAGLTMSRIQEMVGDEYPIIRVMPNTPCAIGSGVILCCRNEKVSDKEYAEFKAIMAGAGTLIDLAENLIDAGSALSGCGPAFVYTFMEAMADAGVACGLTRADAQKLAAATVMGSADMAIHSGKHTAELRDNVCSPGGSTIAGVLSLENDGFRAAVANCVLAAFEKTKELGK